MAFGYKYRMVLLKKFPHSFLLFVDNPAGSTKLRDYSSGSVKVVGHPSVKSVENETVQEVSLFPYEPHSTTDIKHWLDITQELNKAYLKQQNPGIVLVQPEHSENQKIIVQHPCSDTTDSKNSERRIYIPTRGPEEWQRFLTDPEKHWRTGYSAKTLAYCWEQDQGFPISVTRVFKTAPYQDIQELEFILAIPEHKVPLPGGVRPSQNDVFVLARNQKSLMTIAVEGKVAESFGSIVDEWKGISESQGKQQRLQFLCDLLGCSTSHVSNIRYQLLHRTASALIEAKRFHASCAMMMVHSFSQSNESFGDYNTFLSLFNLKGQPNSVVHMGMRDGIDLYFSWVTGDAEFLKM